MTKRTLVVILCISNCLEQIVSPEVILTGTNHTIKCQLNVTLPSWDKLKTETDDSYVIAYYDNKTINPNFYAAERIKYDSNERDILLSNVTLRDAGRYKCSKAQKGEKISTLYVDDFDFSVNCLENSATTGCMELSVVTWKWLYILGNGAKVPITVDNITNDTGCSNGKSRLTSWFKHDDGACIRRQYVSAQFFLQHTKKNDTRVCEKEYHIDRNGCKDMWFVLCITVLVIHVITAGLFCFNCVYKLRGTCERKFYCNPATVCTILAVPQIVAVVLLMFLPPQPDAFLEYDNRSDWIAFIVMIVLWLIVPSYVVINWMCTTIAA